MNYKKIYDLIIERSKHRILTGYKESHHIIPRCLGGTDDEHNLTDLTPEEHYLCHLLLVKIYPNNIKLVKAAMFMTSSNINVKRNNKAYGWLRRQFSEFMKTNNPNLNGFARKKYIEEHGIPVVNKNYITQEWRDNISKRMLGENNPIAGIKAWNHPRATDYTKSIWKQADKIYNVWLQNNKPSYCKLHSLINGKMYDSKSVGPFMNMVKYFRNGWVPTQDTEWTKYK